MSWNKVMATILVIAPIMLTLAQNNPQDYVAKHNIERAKVGVPPLTWSKTVAEYAQNYANSRIERCEFEHSMGPYGENIALGYEGFTGVAAVKLWADEKPNYDHGSNSCVHNVDDGQCLHYTQIVWKNSVHLGCGHAKCKNGRVFITCNYAPAGNVQGEKPY